jgi:uncharacterized repeat protein (TIGR01451 family)
MKRLVAAAVVVGLVGMAMAAGAATSVTNWATSTYQLTGSGAAASGQDSAIVRVQTAPNIVVSKLATNVRTGITDNYQVNAVSGDQVNFTIIWSNTGEATADSVTLNDYIPSGLTYVAASASETAANTAGSVSEAAGLVQWVTDDFQDVPGTDGGPTADGIIKFSALVI